MADNKYENCMKEAERSFDAFFEENPELSQVWMLRGIGFALLAVAHKLKVIEQVISKEEDK